MAFSAYKTLELVQQQYPQIIVKNQKFIPDFLEDFVVKESLKEEIDLNLLTYRSNEFYATENLVSPILRAAWRKYMKEMNMWTHQAIKYDEDLSGTPDFMFTNLEQEQYQKMSYPVVATIVTTVEAKAENFVEGWAQCITQMLACQKINTKPNVIIFGIVTTGKFWEFGKMENNNVIIHTNSYSIENLPKLLGILDYLLNEAKKQL